METIIFFDLENTIITSWTLPNIIIKNITKIKNKLKDTSTDNFGIFSFAIYHDNDINYFYNNGIADTVEKELNIKIDQEIFTIEKLFPIIRESKKIHLKTTLEFFELGINKKEAFIMWTGNKYKNQDIEFFLFDDMVDNEIITIENLEENYTHKINFVRV